MLPNKSLIIKLIVKNFETPVEQLSNLPDAPADPPAWRHTTSDFSRMLLDYTERILLAFLASNVTAAVGAKPTASPQSSPASGILLTSRPRGGDAQETKLILVWRRLIDLFILALADVGATSTSDRSETTPVSARVSVESRVTEQLSK